MKGFAVTLAIGILTTVFTAFTFTRWLIADLAAPQPAEGIAAGASDGFVPPGHQDSVHGHPALRPSRCRRCCRSLSVVLFMTVEHQLRHRLQGRLADRGAGQERRRPISATSAAGSSELNIGDVQVQEFGAAERRADPRRHARMAATMPSRRVVDKVRGELAERLRFPPRRERSVRPSRANWPGRARSACSSRSSAILIYVWFRFEWQFAVGAIIATVHDVVMTIGFFVVTRLEFNLSSIAAILTIVGYSLNDTVVVYDRVRENLRQYKKMPLPELLNSADQRDAVAHDADRR